MCILGNQRNQHNRASDDRSIDNNLGRGRRGNVVMECNRSY
jgi:hypothetical protein